MGYEQQKCPPQLVEEVGVEGVHIPLAFFLAAFGVV
jgi:hypothetical protein